MLITTANYLQNIEIKNYYTPISSSIVIGANLLSDFKASFTDVFGGRSSTYEGKLNNIFEEAKEILISKASKLKANGIIGFTVNYIELGGKDKAMLMITIYGTPVVIDSIDGIEESNDDLTVSKDQFKSYLDAYNIVQNIDLESKNISLSPKEFNTIRNSDLLLFLPIVDAINRVDAFSIEYDAMNRGDFAELNEYFYNINSKKSQEHLFTWLENDNSLFLKNRAYQLLIGLGNLDLELLKTKIRENLSMPFLLNLCINGTKDYYSYEDIRHYEEIYELVEQYFINQEPEIIVEKSFFTTTEMWVCKDCNDKVEIFNKCSCGTNVNKLFKNQTPNLVLEKLQTMIVVLKKLLEKK